MPVVERPHGLQAASRQPSARTFVALLVAFAGLLAYVSAFRHAFIDDAFITFQYARTLAESGTWGFYAGRITNTATSPLNVLLLAAASYVTPSVVDAAVWLTALELLLALVFLVLTSRTLFGGVGFAAIAFAGLAANPLLVSTIGLESILLAAAVAAATWCFVRQRWNWLAVVLALATMTRADAFLLFAVVLVAAPLPLAGRVRLAVVYGLTLLPWEIYSWVHLGSFIPDTMKIKVAQRAWGVGLTFRRGPLVYLEVFPLETILSMALLPFGALLLRRDAGPARRIGAVLAGYAVLHFLAYSVIQVPPYHWYYANQIIPGVVVGALGLASLQWSDTWRRHVTAVAVAGALVPAAGLTALAARTGFHIDEMPIHSNWASHDRYKEMGEWIRANTKPSDVIFCAGEIGTLAYYSERQLVNEFSDLNRISESIVKGEYDDEPVVGPLLRMNFYWRRLQQPYPPLDYWLEAASDERKVAELQVNAVHTWEVSSRFTRWREPSMRLRYVLKAMR